ncbi:hypothetical protein ACIP93_37350 [Streptomyces sp. NPDC088745]|uniref:hypothetical protein n=1 Tax=Streptomyces sp. NPDC088745 TaxID=3365884 RepID=UPI003828F3D9
MTSGIWLEAAAGMKNSPIMPGPVTTVLSRPTDTDGSSTEATPQNTELTATNASDARIHRSRSGGQLLPATW